MALTFINPNTQDVTNFGLQGLRVYAELYDTATSTYSGTIVDFGNIENLSKSRETTDTNIESSRNGVRSIVKVLTSSFTDTATFDTLNVGDPVIAGLFEGKTALTSVLANTKIIIRTPGSKVQARFFVLNPGAPQTDSTLLFIPKVQIEGGEETQSNGTDPARYGFKVTFLQDETYKVPVAVLASNDSAPYGVRGIIEASATPIADLEALIDALTP